MALPMATPRWQEAPGRFKRKFDPANDPTGLRTAARDYSNSLNQILASPRQDYDTHFTGQDVGLDRSFDIDPYGGGVSFTGATGVLPKTFKGYADDPLAWLQKNAPGAIDEYQNYLGKFGQWKNQYTNPALDASIRQSLGGYGALPSLGGTDSAVNRINSNLARYGISSLDQIGVTQDEKGRPLYYDKTSGSQLPDQFAHFKSNNQGTLRMGLATGPDGRVYLKPNFEGPKKQADDYGEDVTLAIIGGIAGGALGPALASAAPGLGTIGSAALGQGISRGAVAGVTGGDVGQAFVTGALGGGLGTAIGAYNPASYLTDNAVLQNILNKSLAGGITGGASGAYSGNVGQGALTGALGGATSAAVESGLTSMEVPQGVAGPLSSFATKYLMSRTGASPSSSSGSRTVSRIPQASPGQPSSGGFTDLSMFTPDQQARIRSGFGKLQSLGAQGLPNFSWA